MKTEYFTIQMRHGNEMQNWRALKDGAGNIRRFSETDAKAEKDRLTALDNGLAIEMVKVTEEVVD
jgi:hypothetical protein